MATRYVPLRVVMELDALTATCQEWQDRLRLADWIIELRICRLRDMELSDVQGECSWKLSDKTARISILDPADYPESQNWPQDMERTLVHELLHLHIAPFDRTHDYDTEVEQAIAGITEALIYSARKSRE